MFFTTQKLKILLFGFITLLISSCYDYRTNLAPKGDIPTDENHDPCFKDDDERLEVLGLELKPRGNSQVEVDLTVKTPCNGSKSPAFNISFYPTAEPVVQPADLENLAFGALGMGIFNGCTAEAIDKANQKIDKIKNKKPDMYNMLVGNGLTFVIGAHQKNSLYLVTMKVGIGNAIVEDNEDDTCTLQADYSPWIVKDISSVSPVEGLDGKPIVHPDLTEAGMAATGNGNLLKTLAPFHTYSPLLRNGIRGVHSTGVHNGSLYKFIVNIKPGSYYVALGKINDLMAAPGKGDYSWYNAKVYSDDKSGVSDYEDDCGKDVTCAGKAKVITIT